MNNTPTLVIVSVVVTVLMVLMGMRMRMRMTMTMRMRMRKVMIMIIMVMLMEMRTMMVIVVRDAVRDGSGTSKRHRCNRHHKHPHLIARHGASGNVKDRRQRICRPAGWSERLSARRRAARRARPRSEERAARALAFLEEQILCEGPGSIAAVLFESVIGSGGAHIPPRGYMEGVRALCDKPAP